MFNAPMKLGDTFNNDSFIEVANLNKQYYNITTEQKSSDTFLIKIIVSETIRNRELSIKFTNPNTSRSSDGDLPLEKTEYTYQLKTI